MRNTLDFFKSTSRYANLVTVAALALWLLKLLWLDTIPEIFRGAHSLGEVVEITLSQIVASYVFYLFFVHKQERDDRAVIGPYVLKHARRVYGNCQAIILDLNSASGQNIDFEISLNEQINDAFAAIRMSAYPNMVVGPQMMKANWIQYFLYYRERTIDSVNKLIALGRLVDPRLSSRLVEISEDSFFLQMHLIGQAPLQNATLEVWGDSFWKYLLKCRELKRWIDQHFNDVS